MPARRASAFAPVAVMLLVRLAGIVLGLRSRNRSGAPPSAPRDDFDPHKHLARIGLPGPARLRRSSVIVALVLVILTGGGVYAGYKIKFAQEARTRAVALTAGNPDLGRDLTRRYGCAACHIIPGVPGAQGRVGPTLQGFAARVYIGGVATNSPDTLIRWIENPRLIDPGTAMPITGISRAEARHVAAYLYTVR